MRIPRNNINLLLYISFTIICSRFWFKTAITSKLIIISYTLRKTASPQLIYLISLWLDLLMPLLSSWSFHFSARSVVLISALVIMDTQSSITVLCFFGTSALSIITQGKDLSPPTSYTATCILRQQTMMHLGPASLVS